MPRPNILFILSDQHHAGVAGYAGDRHARTPNMDRLAAQGTTLDNCYCASPLCVPSRMAMLSTLLPSATGVYSNFHALPSTQPTFVHSLAASGYETTLCGRMHFVGPDQRHGYENRLVGDFTTAHVGGTGQKMGPLSGTTGQHRSVVEKSGPGRSAVIAFDETVTAAAIDFLRNRIDPRPFFLTVGFYGPHCPFVAPRHLFDHYFRELPLPEIPSDFTDTVHPAVRQWLEVRDLIPPAKTAPDGSSSGRFLDSAATPGSSITSLLPSDIVRRARAAYYALVELCDSYVGAIISALEKAGQLDNTLVIYGSDHGEMMGDKHMWWKSNFYDGSARVHMIARWPGNVAAGHRITTPASLCDLGPTLIDLAGGPPMPRTDGRSIWPELGGLPDRDPDRAVVSLLSDIRIPLASAMIRQRQWKLIQFQGHTRVQLFNLQDDPREQNDLGLDPAYESVRAGLLDLLKRQWDPNAQAPALDQMTTDAAFLKAWTKAVPQAPIDQFVWKPEDNYLETV